MTAQTLVRRSVRLALGALLALALGVARAHSQAPGEAPKDVATPDPSAAEVLAPGWGPLSFEPPAAGSYALPALGEAADGEVLDASGAQVRLRELFGEKLVVLSFIYTTCDDVNGCPLATAVLQKLARHLRRTPGLAERVRLISISFDPEHDTPAVMRAYARGLSAPDLDWHFLTAASREALAPVLEAYGQSVVRDVDAEGRSLGTFSHVLRVYLIDLDARIRNIYSVSFLHPRTLANDVRTLLMEGGQSREARGAGAAPAVALGAGDFKQGYEEPDYRTRSRALGARRGAPADLMALVRSPPLGLPPVPIPADNPMSTHKVALGRKLFYDRRLSLNDTISCAMCHVPEQGFTSNEMATAVGIEGRTVRRNAPTLYNVAFLQRLFHDGRETRLEQQVWAPMLASNEMGNPSIGWVLEKLRRLPDYAGRFERAFDGRGPGMETVGEALAAYQRTLLSARSPFDRWRYAGEEGALGVEAKRGFELFTGRAGCAACHPIGVEHALFTDQRMHNTGVGYAASMGRESATRQVPIAPGVVIEVERAVLAEAAEAPPSDLGLYELTLAPADRWKYRTPGLRNVALSAPYMHDGSLATLRAVVEFYNRGGEPNELLDPLIRPLGLDADEVDALVAFLESLTGDNVAALVSDAFAAPIGDLRRSDPNWTHDNRMPFE